LAIGSLKSDNLFEPKAVLTAKIITIAIITNLFLTKSIKLEIFSFEKNLITIVRILFNLNFPISFFQSSQPLDYFRSFYCSEYIHSFLPTLQINNF